MSDAAIGRAVDAGGLHRLFRGVYARGHGRISERGRMLAATLACGPGATVSHRSAAALLGLIERAPLVIDVIAAGDRGRSIDGIRARQVRPLRTEEVGEVDGVPCTSPARTLVDLAGIVGGRTLRGTFERAAASGQLDVEAIEKALGYGRRTGAAALRGLIGEWRIAAGLARGARLRSPLEAKVLPLLLRSGAPVPRANALVEIGDQRFEVDFLWTEQRLVVEADSRRHHDNDVAFERDRIRDRELMRGGYAVLRVTWLQAEREPAAVASAIAAALAERAGR